MRSNSEVEERGSMEKHWMQAPSGTQTSWKACPQGKTMTFGPTFSVRGRVQ